MATADRADAARMTRSVAAARRRGAGEGGFGLVEVVIAITLASVLLVAGVQVLGTSLKTVVYSRSDSQSAELVSATLEDLRNTDYAAVAMVATDLAGDSDIAGAVGAQTFDPDGSGPLPAEPVVLSAGGAVNPHIVDVARNAQTYRLATYVTTPVDTAVTGAHYKRVTVRATWASGTRTHTRQTSTYITLTRRGLPLPNFQVIASTGAVDAPISVSAGAGLTLPFKVVNRGARDAFNLSVSSTPASGVTAELLVDTNADGVENDGDVAPPDSDANGAPDTGALQVDQSISMLAVADVPAATPAGTYTFMVTGRSIGQPDASGATRTATFNVVVGGDTSCVGCTFVPLYLRNVWPPCTIEPCDSTAQVAMPLRAEAPTAPSLGNFDTNVDAGQGRAIARALTTPASTTTSATAMANWRHQVAKDTTLQGSVLVDLYLAVASVGATPGADVPLGVTVYVNRSTSGSGTTELIGQASGALGLDAGAAFRHLQVSVPITSVTVAKNRFVEIKVVVDSTASTTGAWLAYDATGYPAVVRLPVV